MRQPFHSTEKPLIYGRPPQLHQQTLEETDKICSQNKNKNLQEEKKKKKKTPIDQTIPDMPYMFTFI